MSNQYLNPDLAGSVIAYITRHHGSLEMVRGGHWTIWRLNGKDVASLSCSPYPGPEYGSHFWVQADLVEGAEVVVTRHRGLTYTEAHFLNKRIRHLQWHGKPLPRESDCMQLVEVEEMYQHYIKTTSNLKEFAPKIGNVVQWNECVRLG